MQLKSNLGTGEQLEHLIKRQLKENMREKKKRLMCMSTNSTHTDEQIQYERLMHM